MLLVKNARIQIKGNHLDIYILPDDYKFPEILFDYNKAYPLYIRTKEICISKEDNDLLHLSMIEVYYEGGSDSSGENYKLKTKHTTMELYNCSFIIYR